MTPLILRDHVVEPANLWVRHSFSRWPALDEDRLYCDLAHGVLAPATRGAATEPREAAELLRTATDVVYVPPVPADRAALRERVIEAAAAAGAPLLVQVVGDLRARRWPSVATRRLRGGRGAGAAAGAGHRSSAAVADPIAGQRRSPSLSPGGSEPAKERWDVSSAGLSAAEAASASTGRATANATETRDGRRSTGLPANTVLAVDVLDGLVRQAATLREEFAASRQPGLPFEPPPFQDATLVWPLVTGWTDRRSVLDPAMARFAAAGARRVVARTLTLNALDRRLLAGHLQSTWPEAFDAVFHGDDSPPDTPAFRSAVASAGLVHTLPRPLPLPPLSSRLRCARALAGHLIELGDRADALGDAYYRAARFLDRDEVDIEAAAREGNLGVLPWLEAPALQAAEQWLAGRERPAGKAEQLKGD